MICRMRMCPTHSMSVEAKFIDFLRANGATISDKIELTSFLTDGAGRRVLATQDIKKGELLFSIPRHLLLNHFNSKCRTAIESSRFLTGWAPTILTMMYEIVQGDKSKWAPYFAVLPEKLGCPVNWSLEETEKLLQGSPIIPLIGHQVVKDTYNKLILKAITNHHKIFGPPSRYPFELFVRVGTFVGAYAFAVDTGAAAIAAEDGEEVELPQSMVPLADMLNHKAGCNNARIFDDDPANLRMCAAKDIPAGAECYNTYGTAPNSQLLRQYGFVDTSPVQLVRDAAMISDEALLAWAESLNTKGLSTRQKMAEASLLLGAEGGQEITCRVKALHQGGINSIPPPGRPPRDLLSLVFLLSADGAAVKKASAASGEAFPKANKGRALRKFLDADEEKSGGALAAGASTVVSSPQKKRAAAEESGVADVHDVHEETAKKAKIDDACGKDGCEETGHHHHDGHEGCCGGHDHHHHDHDEADSDEEEALEVEIVDGDDEVDLGDQVDEEEDTEDEPQVFPIAARKGVREGLVKLLEFVIGRYAPSAALPVEEEPQVDAQTGALNKEWMAKVALKSEWRLLMGLKATAEDESLWKTI